LSKQNLLEQFKPTTIAALSVLQDEWQKANALSIHHDWENWQKLREELLQKHVINNSHELAVFVEQCLR
jgi:hypothetical protein